MRLLRHSIPEATVSDFLKGNLNENFITNLLLTAQAAQAPAVR